MENESAIKLWSSFRMQNSQAPEICEAWAFGDSKEMADELSGLVLEGLKTATSSAFEVYQVENEPIPTEGSYSIILDGNQEAVGIIQIQKVTTCAFNQVTEELAIAEGEGDRTLEYWRRVHEEFFRRHLATYGLSFNEEMLIVCEQFELVYAA